MTDKKQEIEKTMNKEKKKFKSWIGKEIPRNIIKEQELSDVDKVYLCGRKDGRAERENE